MSSYQFHTGMPFGKTLCSFKCVQSAAIWFNENYILHWLKDLHKKSGGSQERAQLGLMSGLGHEGSCCCGLMTQLRLFPRHPGGTTRRRGRQPSTAHGPTAPQQKALRGIPHYLGMRIGWNLCMVKITKISKWSIFSHYIRSWPGDRLSSECGCFFMWKHAPGIFSCLFTSAPGYRWIVLVCIQIHQIFTILWEYYAAFM
jgi:hypothetical protein